MNRTRIDIDIDIDGVHLAEVMRRYGLQTAAEAVDLALRIVVEELVDVSSLYRLTDEVTQPDPSAAARDDRA